MPWNELKPASSNLLSEAPSALTSNAIALRQAIEKSSFWTDSSGLSAGIPRLSDGSSGPGGARAFFDSTSNMSSALSATKPLAGRLYIANDQLRLYAFSSATSILMGGKRSIVYLPSSATIQNGFRNLVQTGNINNGGSSTVTVTFPTAYAATAPIVQVTPMATSVASMTIAQVNASTTTCFGVTLRNVWGAGTSNTTVLWRSIGTVAL